MVCHPALLAIFCSYPALLLQVCSAPVPVLATVRWQQVHVCTCAALILTWLNQQQLCQLS